MQKSQLPRELVTKTHAKKPTAERVGNCDSSKSQLPKELVTAQKINLPNELVTAIPPAGLRAASPIPTSTTALSKLSLQTCWDFPTKHSLWLASFGLVSHGFHRLGLASFGLWLRSLVTSMQVWAWGPSNFWRFLPWPLLWPKLWGHPRLPSRLGSSHSFDLLRNSSTGP